MNIERELVKPIRNRLRQSSRTEVSVKNNEDEVVSRYPKRGQRKKYKEDDVPDDDRYLCKLFLMLVMFGSY